MSESIIVIDSSDEEEEKEELPQQFEPQRPEESTLAENASFAVSAPAPLPLSLPQHMSSSSPITANQSNDVPRSMNGNATSLPSMVAAHVYEVPSQGVKLPSLTSGIAPFDHHSQLISNGTQGIHSTTAREMNVNAVHENATEKGGGKRKRPGSPPPPPPPPAAVHPSPMAIPTKRYIDPATLDMATMRTDFLDSKTSFYESNYPDLTKLGLAIVSRYLEENELAAVYPSRATPTFPDFVPLTD